MKKLALAMLVLIALAGCGREYVMENARDMHAAAIIDIRNGEGAGLSDSQIDLSVMPMKLNIQLFLSENTGKSTSWVVGVWDQEGKLKHSLLTPIGQEMECEQYLMPLIPEPIEKIEGWYVGYFSHDGALVFNSKGEYRMVDPIWKAIDPREAKYKDFFVRIKANENTFPLKSGSRERANIAPAFDRYKKNIVETGVKYANFTYGTDHTPEEWDEIASRDTVVYGLKEALTDDFYVFLMGNFTEGVQWATTGIATGFMKIVNLGKAFGTNLDRKGYREFMMNAWETAGMVLQGLEYGKCRERYQSQSEMIRPVPQTRPLPSR